MDFTYSDGTKVGQHEEHLRKVGRFSLENPYTVTFVSEKDTVEFFNYETKESTVLNAGTILNTCGLLKTNSARVEIRNNEGDLYRLVDNSDFSIEYTIEGVKPVFYGNVLYASEDIITYSPEKIGHLSSMGGNLEGEEVENIVPVVTCLTLEKES